MEYILRRVPKFTSQITFDAYTLKIIAIVTMVCDHVGALFFPDDMVFRIVGRLTAPIFAFFITEGYRKTRNVKQYIFRLGLFAVISMIPYHLIFKHSYFDILFDFLFGLLAIYTTDRLNRAWLKWMIVIGFAVLAFFLQTDGMLGMCILVYLFHRYRDQPRRTFTSMAVLYLFQVIMLVMHGIFARDASVFTDYMTWIRPLALCSLFFIFRYNGEKGRNMKYLFYAFYPGHLMILYGISQLSIIG